MGMNTRYVKEYFYKKKIRSTFVWILEIIAAILLAAASVSYTHLTLPTTSRV